MPVIRLLLAGLVALGAILAAIFAAALVVFGAVVAFVLQLFGVGPKVNVKVSGTRTAFPRSASPRPHVRPGEDVIEVETTEVGRREIEK